MPKTVFQSVVFSAIMAFCMVFCMSVYTISMNMGGLSYPVFGMAISEMWLEFVVVIVIVMGFVSKAAQKLALRILTPGEQKPIFFILAIQYFTVCIMVPCMTLFATFVHNGASYDWFTNWIELACKCFPMALCLQIFFVGPFVRWVFRTIFRMKRA